MADQGVTETRSRRICLPLVSLLRALPWRAPQSHVWGQRGLRPGPPVRCRTLTRATVKHRQANRPTVPCFSEQGEPFQHFLQARDLLAHGLCAGLLGGRGCLCGEVGTESGDWPQERVQEGRVMAAGREQPACWVQAPLPPPALPVLVLGCPLGPTAATGGVRVHMHKHTGVLMGPQLPLLMSRPLLNVWKMPPSPPAPWAPHTREPAARLL